MAHDTRRPEYLRQLYGREGQARLFIAVSIYLKKVQDTDTFEVLDGV
jgi:hypothetical protein